MKRLQSILSFFHKPSTDKPPSNPNPPRGNPTSDVVTGTDTPPEKEQRSFFAAEAKGSGGSMFNSIKHKFMRPNSVVQKPSDRNSLDGEHDNIHLTSNKNNLSNVRDKESSQSGFPRMKNVIDLDEAAGEGDKRHPLLVESDSEGDITGPETPGARPLVPRLKRVQVDGFNFGSATTHSSTDNSKRVKFSHDLAAEGNKAGVASEISKRVTFSLDSAAENKKPEPSFDNSKRVKKPAEETNVKMPSEWNSLDGGHDNIHSTSNNNNLSNGRDKESLLSGFPRMKDVIDLDETDVIDLDETAGEGDKRHPLLVDSEGDITGPETPGARPLVPRLKRVQEDGFNFGSATTHSTIDNSKRVKFSHDFSAEGSKGSRGKGKKKVRRITMNVDLKKAVALNGPQKIDFDIDDQGTYIHVGPHASWFSNYVGELVREFPYYYRSWRDIPAADKAHVHDRLSKHFDIASHLAGPHGQDIRDGIEDYFNRQYRGKKHHHKVKHFTKKGGVAKAEEIRSQHPENVTPEDWNRQVDFWIDPKRVHVAEVNSRNRMANTISCLQGSRSLAATRHNLFMSSPEGVYPDLIQTYYDSHTKDGVWKEPEAEARYNEMIRLREASTSSGIAMTDREILAQVLKGKQRGHIPGVGRKVAGVGKSSIFGSQSRQQSYSSAEIDEKMKKQAEETKAAKEAAKKLEKELATTQQQVSQMMAFLSSQPAFADQFARAFSSSNTNDGNDDGEGNGDGDEE